MKLHLPLSLLSALVAVFAVQSACAYDIPDQYANAGIDIYAPQDMDDYRSLNWSESYMFQFYNSATFNSQTNRNWYAGNSLVSGSYCLFTTAEGAKPVSLSFDGTDRLADAFLQTQAFNAQELIFANLNKLQIENAGQVRNPDDENWNYYDISSGAVGVSNDFSVTEVNEVVFKNNASSYTYNTDPQYFEYNTPNSYISYYTCGGAVSADSVSLCQNGDITFEGNKVHFDSTKDTDNAYTDVDVELKGGAIYGDSYHAELAISDNSGKVSFTGNSVELIQGATSNLSTLAAYGGAVYKDYGITCINGNADVTFSGNVASATSAGGDANIQVGGGAVYSPCGISIDGNADVTFSGNVASATSSGGYADTYVRGGAIYAEGSWNIGAIVYDGNISICNNASVNFEDNAIEVTSNDCYFCYVQGGAIYSSSYDSLVDISNNGDVSFTGNSIKVNIGNYNTLEYGGAAIYAGGDLRINNNASVEFSDNYAEISCGDGYSTDECSAIYASNNLEIAGNESVVFRNNSGYAIEHKEDTMKLSAKTGGHITFYDRVSSNGTAELNADYVDGSGQLQKASGDIIFSGAPREDGSYNDKSSYLGKTTLHGGTLQVVDNAHLHFDGVFSTVAGSGARVLLRDGYLYGYSSSTSYRAIISSGTSLEVSGHSLASNLTLATGSSLVVNLDESHLAKAALTTWSNNGFSIENINLCVNMEGEKAKGLYQILNLGSTPGTWTQENITVTGSGAAAGATFGDLMWQAGVLYYVASPLWSNHGGSGIWSTDAANWNSGVAYRQGQDVTFTDLGAGEVKLSGNLAPGSITVQNTVGNDYAFVAAESGGKLTGSTSLTKAGAGALSLATANDYTGDTEVLEGTLNVQHSTALGATAEGDSALKMASNTNLNISNGSKVVLAAAGNDIQGKVTVDAGASLEMKNSGYLAQTSTVNGTLVFTGQAASVPQRYYTTLSGTGSVVVNDAVVKFYTQSGFTGNVSVQGSDAVLYTGSGAYRGAGTLTVNQGTLGIGSSNYSKSGLTLTTGGKVELISNKDAVAELYAQTVSIEKGSVLSVKAAAVAREQEVLQALAAAPATAEDGEIAFNPLLAEHATEGADLYVSNLQLKGGSTLALEEAFIDLNGGRLTLAVPGAEKIALTLSGSLDYYSDTQVVLFANAGVVNFVYENMYMEGTDWSALAEDYFTNEWITSSTTINYDGETGTVYLEGLCVVPEPTTSTLSLLALAGLCARRRRR
ncbi:MAG: autotransporter-associated beta strand repeat-containing protein [Akkermansia sp.]|nr:autotransporter-associated beta strand repeat-containing protein [Akkermansia sp.]